MENKTQTLFQVKIITDIEVIERGYEGDKYLKPNCEVSKYYKAPVGRGCDGKAMVMPYDDATKVIARLFKNSCSFAEDTNELYRNFDNYMSQYGFEAVEKQDSDQVANLYIFVDKKFRLFQKSNLKRQLKKKEVADFGWATKDASNANLDEIYDNIGLFAPHVINLINDDN